MSNERKSLVTMADVRLHCGELNERERVAVRWVIDKYALLAQERDEAIKHLRCLTEYWPPGGTIAPFAEDVENAVNFLAKYPKP